MYLAVVGSGAPGASITVKGIDSLRRKPRAFLHCTWQQELLPNDNYRQLWEEMLARLDAYNACRLMVEALYIAAKLDKEQAILTYLRISTPSRHLFPDCSPTAFSNS